jgi:hypothetical protein
MAAVVFEPVKNIGCQELGVWPVTQEPQGGHDDWVGGKWM